MRRGNRQAFGEREALRGVSFEADPGEQVAVIGPNGAGKTTLLSILAGICKPDEGEVSSADGEVGWVPQQAALYRRLTVEENLLLFARLEGHEDPRASAEEMLELTGLRERRGEIVARLSGGNQQRINIAIGLLSRPAVLLLDEPSVGLDPRQRSRLWEFVSALADRGTTVIFSTHDIQEAERYGGRLLVLADGEALFDGAARGAARGGAPRGARGRRPRLRDRLRRLPAPPGALMRGVRWLLLKDLQILRRSPLQAVLLVAYPILIAVLVGFAISRGPEKPRVAFLNEVPAGDADHRRRRRAALGERQGRICERVECVFVADREEAEAKVKSGDVLAALVLPANLVNKINSLSTLTPGVPEVEVLVNEENAVKAELVDDRITSLLAQANLAVARRIGSEGGRYLNLIVNGGEFKALGGSFHILGLRTSATILEAVTPALPKRCSRR